MTCSPEKLRMPGRYFIVFARSCRLGHIRERMASMLSSANTVDCKIKRKTAWYCPSRCAEI